MDPILKIVNGSNQRGGRMLSIMDLLRAETFTETQVCRGFSLESPPVRHGWSAPIPAAPAKPPFKPFIETCRREAVERCEDVRSLWIDWLKAC